jgi:hypothetical protein
MSRGKTVEDLMSRFLSDAKFRAEVLGAKDPEKVLKQHGYAAPQSLVDRFKAADPAAVEKAVEAYEKGGGQRPTC